MANILITGANGFVGHALAPALRARGHRLSGTTREAQARNGPGGIPLLRIAELGPDTDWTRALSDAEIVVHLAARVHVMKETAAEADALYTKANTEGTRRLALAAAAAGVRRLIYLSSTKAAGESSGATALLESDAASPEDAYGRSKLAAEAALAEIAEDTGMEIVVFRPPLIYGPGVKGSFLRLLEACRRRIPLPLGSVANQRSMVYGGNLADAIAASLENPAAAGETFYIEDGQPTSTPDLIRHLSKALGVEARLLNAPVGLLELAGLLSGRRDTIARLTGSLVISSAKLRDRLDWTPPYAMAAGLQATADWYLSERV